MKPTLLFKFVFFTLMGFATQLSAAPLGYKNSWMVMGDFSKTYQELSANYSTTANDAFGVSVSAMQTEDSVSRRQLVVWVLQLEIPLAGQKQWLRLVFRSITKPLVFTLWHLLEFMQRKEPLATSLQHV
jgi:hypothetical protein